MQATTWTVCPGDALDGQGWSEKKAEVVFLVCEESARYNYASAENRAEELQLKKYCPQLRKHTLHTEKKK